MMPAWFDISAHGSFEEIWEANVRFIEDKFHSAVTKTRGHIQRANDKRHCSKL